MGSREQLEKRLRELQKAKAAKKAAAAATAGAGSPSSATLFSLHSSNTADAPSSLEWSERLRQAKAKYWSNLDQLAPEWKSNTQQRRLEQLAKYEQAIGQTRTNSGDGQPTLARRSTHRCLLCACCAPPDALLVRRQQASLAYAKERELQKLLTEKQLELAQLALHEREEVRARQEARYQSEGLPKPPTLAQQVNSSARAHFLDEQATRPVSPPMPPPARQQQPMYDGSAAAGAGPDAYDRDDHYYPQQQQQQQVPNYRGNDSGYSRASSSHPQQQPQQYQQPRGPPPSFSILPDDAAADAEYHASRVERSHRDVLDLEAWRQESAAEVALRRARREERELADMRERRVAMERRKAQEMEQEEHIRLMILHKQTARLNGETGMGPPSPQQQRNNTMHPPTAQPQPRFSEVHGDGQYGGSQSYLHATATAPVRSALVTTADPMPAARSTYSPTAAAPARHYSSGAADPSIQPAHASSDRGYLEEQQRLDSEARAELQRQQEEDRAMDERARMREEQQRREEEQRRQQQQQMQQQQQLQSQQQLQQQQQQQEQQRMREQQQREQQQQQQREAEAAQQRADAAAAAAAAEAQAQAARDAAASAAAAARPATPPSPKPSAADDDVGPAPVSSLFGGGSSLGFLGKGRKKPQARPGSANASAATAARPATAPVAPAASAAAPKPASGAAAAKKKPAAGSDDDSSEEDETELKTVPALSSAMLLKKKSAPGRINSRVSVHERARAGSGARLRSASAWILMCSRVVFASCCVVGLRFSSPLGVPTNLPAPASRPLVPRLCPRTMNSLTSNDSSPTPVVRFLSFSLSQTYNAIKCAC